MEQQAAQFSWTHMGAAVVMMVIMAFFTTGAVEVAKDFFYYAVIGSSRVKYHLRRTVHLVTNPFRYPDKRIVVTYEEPQAEATFFSETASKLIAFFVALWLCFAVDYGAIDDIVQYGVHAKGTLAIYTDYVFTASIIRLGAVQVYDLLAMLTEKLLAAKELARRLTAEPVGGGQ